MSGAPLADSIEHGFLSSLRAQPGDEAARLVYADWLEEQGRSAEGQFLRLQVSIAALAPNDPELTKTTESLRVIAQRVPPEWRRLVARAPIEGCEVRFDFACPKKWEGLAPTDRGEDVRFCDACKKNVYYTQTVAEALDHAQKGDCVVVDLVQIRRPFDLMGRPDPIPMPTAGMPLPLPPPPPPILEPSEKIGPIRAAFRRLWSFGRHQQ